MKKVKFEGKLSLKKEVVAKLNEAQLKKIKGGSTPACSGANCTGPNCGDPSLGVTGCPACIG